MVLERRRRDGPLLGPVEGRREPGPEPVAIAGWDPGVVGLEPRLVDLGPAGEDPVAQADDDRRGPGRDDPVQLGQAREGKVVVDPEVVDRAGHVPSAQALLDDGRVDPLDHPARADDEDVAVVGLAIQHVHIADPDGLGLQVLEVAVDEQDDDQGVDEDGDGDRERDADDLRVEGLVTHAHAPVSRSRVCLYR